MQIEKRQHGAAEQEAEHEGATLPMYPTAAHQEADRHEGAGQVRAEREREVGRRTVVNVTDDQRQQHHEGTYEKETEGERQNQRGSHTFGARREREPGRDFAEWIAAATRRWGARRQTPARNRA